MSGFSRSFSRRVSLPILVVASEPGSGSVLGPMVKRLVGVPTVVASSRAAVVLSALSVDCLPVADPSDAAAADRMIAALLDRQPIRLVVTTLLGRFDTSLDHAALRVAGARGLTTVAVLDSWSCLDARFEYQVDHCCGLPDHVMVPDDHCLGELSSLGIPAERLKVCGHPFFDHIQIRDQPVSGSGGVKRIGFLLQPLRALAEAGALTLPGYDEARVVALFFEALDRLPADLRFAVVFKEHPRRESVYELPSRYADRVSVDRSTDGWSFCCSCDAVCTMSSTLGVYAYAGHIPTLVCQPNLWGDDPNMLSRYGLVPNLTAPEQLADALVDALCDPTFQQAPHDRQARAGLLVGGDNAGRLAEWVMGLIHR